MYQRIAFIVQGAHL